jgi:CDP-6-deoxy-D-xylo-4-hexulose-3-dehydrase
MSGEWLYPTAYSVWGSEEYAAIERVVASGQFTMGPEVAAFEREFADFHGAKHCVMVNSGSSANLIMLDALTYYDRGLQASTFPGSLPRAYVPAIAWSTTYAPFMQRRVDISLLDVDDSWNASISRFTRHVVGEVKPRSVIVGCSILGNPTCAEVFSALAFHNECYYVEDNCESFGAVSRVGNRCGTLGLMNTFSFFYSHQISAIEGGAVLTNSDDCAHLLRMLRAHGWTRDTPEVRDAHVPFDKEYDFRLPGYNVRPTEIHAAVARAQLSKHAEHLELRQINQKYFHEAAVARGVPIRLPYLSGKQSPFGLHFCCLDSAQRERAVAALRAAGVDCRMPTGGSFRQHPYAAPYVTCATPQADMIHDTGMFIGNGPLDLTEQIDLALKVIKEAA